MLNCWLSLGCADRVGSVAPQAMEVSMFASNLLLNAMPEEICRELYDLGVEMRLHSGDPVSSAWLDGSYVFIVTRGIASKFQRSPIGRISEVGMVGREGLFPVC